MSSPKQPKQQQSQQTTNAPWAGVQPYLSALYSGAQNQILNNPQEFYPGQTYANLSPQTTNALNAVTNYATNFGTPLIDQSSGYAQDVLGGKYLNQQNPALEGITNALGDTIQGQTSSRFAGAGRSLGSPAEVQTFQRTLANAVAPQQFQQYAQERQLQQQAAQMLPGLETTKDAMARQNLQALLGVGQTYDQQEQAKVQDAVARWNFAQQEPAQRLQQYGNLLSIGSPYGTQTTTQPGIASGGWGAGLGGALTGAGTGALAGSMFGPAGMGVGAGIGGLLGLGSGLWSDRRLKRDIMLIGFHANGIPVYSYRYIWDDELRIGHMADEVKSVVPWAVDNVNGYDTVNYRFIGW